MVNTPGFKTKQAVHNYLIGIGYDMGVSKLSSKLANCLKDIKKKGGMWLQADIDTYAPIWGFNMMEGAMSADASALDIQIKKADLRKREGDAEKVEHENKIRSGKYILKSEVEMLLSARAKLLYDGVKSFGVNMASRTVDLVKGDQSMTPDLIELYTKEMATLFDHYSRPVEFEVPAFTEEEED